MNGLTHDIHQEESRRNVCPKYHDRGPAFWNILWKLRLYRVGTEWCAMDVLEKLKNAVELDNEEFSAEVAAEELEA